MFKHILVPTDFGEASERALDRAIEIAKRFESQITLLHVAQLPPYYYAAYAEGLSWPVQELQGAAREALDKATAAARLRWPKVEGALAVGAAKNAIVDEATARQADLIVMGTHGRRGVARAFLGSVAENVVRTAPVPVMTTAG